MEDLIIQKGITESQIEALIGYSKTDRLIKKFTSDAQRFKNRPAFNEWSKKKKIFVLTNNDKELLGIFWAGKKKIPDALKKQYPHHDTTIAIRLYNKARGIGLSRWFMGEVLRRLTNKHIWLSCDSRNKAAEKLYSSLGFKPVKKDQKTHEVCMIL